MSGTSERTQENMPLFLGNDLCAFQVDSSSTGGIAWWLGSDEEPLLIDCPDVTKKNIDILKKLARNSRPRILLTSREGHGRVAALQAALDWPVLLHEQEAYLLPALEKVETFSEELVTAAGVRLLWTPGPTPGSCVAHVHASWNVLFCGRLLSLVEVDRLAPLQTRKTFHWRRQRESLKKLRQWVPSNPLPSLALGSGSGGDDCMRLFEWDDWKEPFWGDEPMFN
ncbi:MBL fold metallo-hydrolase [Prochlorococcus sp. MIT 1341]|uniref:MBL fold metallo-hydrolase n=1 Tax=Prochlorococcus sp. MIT 1341 TaxID=3096221 RepID=UPI002A74DEEC|nr:MBL fold metallo-hydrolase [Prochlorococcus sp. MIT 1341]